MGPCFESYLSYIFDQPEKIRDRAKMNLASHRVWRLWKLFRALELVSSIVRVRNSRILFQSNICKLFFPGI